MNRETIRLFFDRSSSLGQALQQVVVYRRALILFSTIAVPAVIGVCEAGRSGLGWNASIVSTVQIVLLILAGLCGVLLTLLNAQPIDFVEIARRSIEDEEAAQSRIAELEGRIRRLAATSSVVSTCLDAIDAFSTRDRPSRTELGSILSLMLASVVTQRESLFSIGGEERWNFAIYLYIRERGRLECLAYDRNDKAERHVPRSWKPGTGHVGQTFASGASELLNRDISQEPVFRAHGADAREDDAERYKAVFSVCIQRNAGTPPVGVCVASSDAVGRFTDDNVQPLRELADAISSALLAGRCYDDYIETTGERDSGN